MRLRLHQTFGAHTGRRFDFEQPVIRLGRLPGSDVAFDPHADLDASGRHAEIRREAGSWILTDVGSRNGTFVNGERVRRHVLADGDELEFGPGGPRLRVELAALAPGEPEVVARPYDATQAATPAPAPDPAVARPHDVTQAATPAPGSPAARPPLTPPSSPHAPAHPGTAASPPGAPVQGPEAGPKRYGDRTVGLMMRDLLASAGRSRSLRVAVGALAVALCFAVAALAWALLRLGRPPGPDPAHVAAANAGALYRVVEQEVGGAERVLCTAFAVRRDLLATTARCVLGIEARRAAGSQVEVRGATGPASIVRLWRHPGFVPGAEGPDVGLVEIGGATPQLVTLAPLGRLRRLRDCDRLLAYGFEGDVARGTPLEVSAVGGDAQAVRLRHGAEVTPGSPVFDADGVVVGVHSGGLLPPSQDARGVSGYVVGSDALVALLAGLGR